MLRLTAAGGEVMRGRREIALHRVPEPPERERRRRRDRGRAGTAAAGAANAGLGPAEVELFERLRELRREIAIERGVPPYVVFHDSTLRELARLRPRNDRELRSVKGIGERKALDYGPRLLAALGAQGETGSDASASFAAEESDLFEFEG